MRTPEQSAAQSLRARIKNFANKNNVDGQLVIQNYMLERFLVRLAASEYKDEFIVKGGLLIAQFIGIKNRYTRDIDFSTTGFQFSEEELQRRIKEICGIDASDGATFEFVSMNPIRDEDEYGGYRVKLRVIYGSMITPIYLDISTGDAITPAALTSEYKPLLGENPIKLKTYNIETILAEKLHTILERGLANTRMRDFYDVYAFAKLRADDINFAVLTEALGRTDEARGGLNVLEVWRQKLTDIESSERMLDLWKRFAGKTPYAVGLTFNTVCEATVSIIESMENNE
jgi:predicted nucleotidyltransferase component of viral defense system